MLKMMKNKDTFVNNSVGEISVNTTEVDSSFLQSESHQTGKTTHPFLFNSNVTNIQNAKHDPKNDGPTNIETTAVSTAFTDLRNYCPNYRLSRSLFTATNTVAYVPPARSIEVTNTTLSAKLSSLSYEKETIKDYPNKESQSKWRCSRCSHINLVESLRCTCCLYLNDGKTTNSFD